MDNQFMTSQDIYMHVQKKYGDSESMGWSPRRRIAYGYTLPGDVYECFLEKVVNKDTRWVDVGGGRSVLPHNTSLSEELSNRCSSLSAVDPSDNVFDNPFAHEKIRAFFEDMQTSKTFNLATFRMVAEHVEKPERVLEKLKVCVDPGGLVVIYTINKYCPIPLLTRITPFSWHHQVKKFIWGGEERDTFPVAYKMNSRKELNSLFLSGGNFELVMFQKLDDVSATINFDLINRIEMIFWKLFNVLGVRYIENNILAVYRRVKE